jgi:hypothetical protein
MYLCQLLLDLGLILLDCAFSEHALEALLALHRTLQFEL